MILVKDITFAKDTDKEFGAADRADHTDSYRASRIRSYVKNELKTKRNVIRNNR